MGFFTESHEPLPFDAYMLLVESVGKRLLYSSDFLRIAPI